MKNVIMIDNDLEHAILSFHINGITYTFIWYQTSDTYDSLSFNDSLPKYIKQYKSVIL